MILIKRLFAQQFFFPIDFDLSDYLLWTDRKKRQRNELNLQFKIIIFALNMEQLISANSSRMQARQSQRL